MCMRKSLVYSGLAASFAETFAETKRAKDAWSVRISKRLRDSI